jgi:hypothetical protein
MASDAKETLRGRILNVARNVAKTDFSGFALLSRLQLNLWLWLGSPGRGERSKEYQ